MNATIKYLFGSFLLIIVMNSCTMKAYESDGFSNLPEKTVAILPYEVIFEGVTPRRYTQEDLERFAIGDSQLFQASLYRSIVDRERRNKRFNLNVQDFGDTNFLLAQAGIKIKDSWYKDPQELAKILGVDAVVRSSVNTRKFLSDAGSGAIAITTTILDIVTDSPVSDDDVSTNGNVFVKTAIIDSNSGNVIWSASENVPTNYSLGTERAVDLLNRRIIRRMRIAD